MKGNYPIRISNSYVDSIYKINGRRIHLRDRFLLKDDNRTDIYEFKELKLCPPKGGYTVPINYEQQIMDYFVENKLKVYNNMVKVIDLHWGCYLVSGYFYERTE